jgi:predicted branched-subunit amino acid permease
MTPRADPSGLADEPPPSATALFFDGLQASFTSVFALVLIGTYVGIGALAHDYGFPLPWVLLSTLLIWAGPAQVILISALGTGAGLVETGVAVGLSAVRLLPMVIALLPLIRSPQTRTRDLLLPSHFTAASMWVECFRLLPPMPRESRVAFSNGLGIGFMLSAHIGSIIGFYLAASLPALLTAGLLFLTPMSFLVSTARNSGTRVLQLALGFGLAVSTVLIYAHVGLDLLWTGIIGGSGAYLVHRLHRGKR